MSEVVSVQIGRDAGFAAALWWNLQHAAYKREALEGNGPAPLPAGHPLRLTRDHGQVFSLNGCGAPRPRLVAVDFAGTVAVNAPVPAAHAVLVPPPFSFERRVFEAKHVAHAAFFGRREPSSFADVLLPSWAPRRQFEPIPGFVSRAAATGAALPPSATASPAEVDAGGETSGSSPRETVARQTDGLPGPVTFSSLDYSNLTAAAPGFVDSIFDRMRLEFEDADCMQALHLWCDWTSGLHLLAEKVAEHYRDEFPKRGLLVLGAPPPAPAFAADCHFFVERALNAAFFTARLFELTENDGHDSTTLVCTSINEVSPEAAGAAHFGVCSAAAAPLALAVDSLTLPYRHACSGGAARLFQEVSGNACKPFARVLARWEPVVPAGRYAAVSSAGSRPLYDVRGPRAQTDCELIPREIRSRHQIVSSEPADLTGVSMEGVQTLCTAGPAEVPVECEMLREICVKRGAHAPKADACNIQACGALTVASRVHGAVASGDPVLAAVAAAAGAPAVARGAAARGCSAPELMQLRSTLATVLGAQDDSN